MISDKADDVKAGAAANVKSFLGSTGYGARQQRMTSTEWTYAKRFIAGLPFHDDEFRETDLVAAGQCVSRLDAYAKHFCAANPRSISCGCR